MTTPTSHGAMPELMACPFCGGKAAVVPRAVNIALQKDPSDPKFGVSIICAQCSSETANMVDEAHAAAKWNTRAAIRRETHIIEPPDFDPRPGVTDGMSPDDLWQYACLVGYRYKLSEHDREQSTRAAIQQAAGAAPEYHLIERIAQHWDACIYNTDNGEMDIGAAIRQNAKLFAASLAPPKQQPTETEALRTHARAMDVARLQGRLEAFAMALTECGRTARRDGGSVGARDCSEIRQAIDILHLNTLQQMGKLK